MNVAAQGPDFLVVGAQRAGTTWLHRVLRQHPQLWLPPVKELHYFDKPEIARTILSAHERRRVGLKRLASLDPWQLRFWLLARDDAWYASLFRAARERGLVTGEITPAYATLSEAVLRRVRNLNADMKLVYVMRDPIERAWSAVNNAAKKGGPSPSHGTMAIARARESGAAARSAYAESLERLETVFPASRIHCCFFEDLRARPESMVRDLLRFLDVEPIAIALPPAVNVAAGSKAVPIEFARALARDYLPMVEKLCRRFEGPPHAWRTRYERLLAEADADSRMDAEQDAAAVPAETA